MQSEGWHHLDLQLRHYIVLARRLDLLAACGKPMLEFHRVVKPAAHMCIYVIYKYIYVYI